MEDQLNPSLAAPLGVAATVDALQPLDYAAWLRLAQGYKTFYETALPESRYQQTWQRLQQGDGVYALGARVEGQLVGIAHYLFHTSVWSADVCYLQDLFVDETVRSRGVAQALIDAVAAATRAQGATRLYWLTHHTNARARRLYDRVAQHHGFVRYDYALD